MARDTRRSPVKIGNSRLRSLAHSAVYLIAALYWAVPYAGAQGYPTKPVRLILSFAGGTDMVGRWLAQNLSGSLGQRVVPDPRVGAGGNIAHEATAKSPPDGYTLLMASSPIVVNPHMNPNVGYDPLRDFAPVALVASIPNVLVVHPSVPARTLGELVRIARSSPGKLTHGSGGIGSTNHLAAELLKLMAKIQIVHVPYKSAVIGATTGEVDIVILTASSVAPIVAAGRVRPLAVLDAKRIASMPTVPTSAEAGMTEFTAVNWYMLLAPAGTPREIVERLNADSAKVMMTAETRERFAIMGGEPTARTPEQTAEFLRTEYTRWGKVVREAGVKAE